MFYENNLPLKSIKYKNFKIDSFGNLNTDTKNQSLSIEDTSLAYNFNSEGGVLTDGLGVGELFVKYTDVNVDDQYKIVDAPTDSSSLVACWLFNPWIESEGAYRSLLVFQSSVGEFYYNDLHTSSTTLIKIPDLIFDKKPLVKRVKCEGRDSLFLYSDDGDMYVWRYPEYLRKVSTNKTIKDFCIHNNKLFVITRNDSGVLYLTDNTDITSFGADMSSVKTVMLENEYGFSNKLISFLDDVYLFKDFNISKISINDETEEILLNDIIVSNGKIFENTICVCGKMIIYLASDGVYSFDGKKSSKINLKISKLFDCVNNNSKARAVYKDGYYYLACNVCFNNNSHIENELSNANMHNNAIIRINAETFDVIIMRGYDVRDLSLINDTYYSYIMVTIFDKGILRLGILDTSGIVFGEPTQKLWSVPLFEVGQIDKEKIVDKISLLSKSDILIQIYCDNYMREFNIKGSDVYQSFRPLVKGKKIKIDFVSKTNGCYIASPQFYLGYL
ncbi:MAG: hypothetical protein IJW59_01920 [Clostridia bacterium]|nr:hypothetical protein [Clostridia bacterium]